MIMKYVTKCEAETLEVAHALAGSLKPGTVVALIGELGTGKTVFVRGVAQAFGVKEDITSPTFTLIHEYQGSITLYHMDLYRINNIREILDIGIEDYLYSDGISLVEWADKLGDISPKDAIRVYIKHLGDNHREIGIERQQNLER